MTPMVRTFEAKLSISPSGIVKISDGVGIRKPAPRLSNRLILPTPSRIAPPRPSLLVNRSKLQDGESSELKRGSGLLGNKSSMSLKTSKNLRERMVSVELEYGRHNTLFITLTLPSSDKRSFEGLARYSSFAVNRMSVWLSDRFGSDNIARVGVWEYQKRGAPHYHFCLASETMHTQDLKELRYDMAVVWMHILESIELLYECSMFAEKNGIERDKQRLLTYKDLGKRFCNIQVVKKSVAAYLSFYLTTSNHSKDDKRKDKQSLRKSFFPIATWSQWNRKATVLFNKFNVSHRIIIDASEFETWNDLKKILLDSIPIATDTEQREKSNLWWHWTAKISDIKGLPLLEIVKDWMSLLKASNIEILSMGLIRFRKKQATKELCEYEGFIHDEKVARHKCDAYCGSIIGQRLADNLEQLLLLMLDCESKLIEHKSFDACLSNYHQLNIQ